MSAFRTSAGWLAVLLVAGCSALGGSHRDESGTGADGSFGEFNTARHGLVTVDEVLHRSDIVVMPPTIEHVIWVRSSQNGRSTWSEVREEEPVLAPSVDTHEQAERETVAVVARTPDAEYPLLRDHGAFDTEYGRVPMCMVYGALEPCTDRDRYECFASKGGGYCLERSVGP